LVVPRTPVDKWTDLDDATWRRLNEVALEIGRVLDATFECVRVGTIVAGLEVPHCHLHLVPIRFESDLNFANARHDTPAEELDEAAARIRAGLRERGHADVE
jgi:diadenosine tetraphosphate (Ap4A) HIT family hydrolase